MYNYEIEQTLMSKGTLQRDRLIKYGKSRLNAKTFHLAYKDKVFVINKEEKRNYL